MEDAIALVMKVMSKTMDSTTLGSEKRKYSFITLQIFSLKTFTVEFATLTLDPETKKPRAKIYRPTEVDALLLKHGLAKKEDTEMK